MKPQFALIEGAISCGSPTRGSEFAYDALVAGGLPGLLGGAVCYPMEKLEPCGTFPPNLHHLDTVMEVSRRLRQTVLTALEQGQFPMVVGGDHSLAMGSLAALGEHYGAENVAVVYVDAHADINTEQTTVSGCIHGMSLAAACGLCCDELTVGKQKVNLLGENIHIIGGRSIDPPEYDIMAAQGVHFYSAEGIRKHGADWVLEQMLPQLAGKRVHISFDVDSLDTAEFFATGYNLPGGLTMERAAELMERVLATGQVCSFECVEYDPMLDPEGTDGRKLLELFRRLFG